MAASGSTTSLKLDADLRERLRRLAEARRRAPHWLMREAVAPYVAREEGRERLRADALAAWAEFEATGHHAPHAEVDAWLARLEAGEEGTIAPACRS